MHVLHVISFNSSVPYFNWLADRIRQYPGVKFSFVALYPEKPQMIEDMKQRGCDCYWIPFDVTRRKSAMLSSAIELYSLFKKIKPDVVNTHLFYDTLPGIFAAKWAGIKIRVITKNDTSYHWIYSPQWVKVDRFNNASATHVIAISNEAKKFIIEKEKAAPDKVYMIHHGISIPDITRQKEEYKNELRRRYDLDNKIVIGTICRYIEWKGYKYIIEAARTIKEKYKNVKFIFTGTGDQKSELAALVNKYDLKDVVVFTDWIDRDYIPSLYGIMDIYLHAAVMEPFGFVIAEAMANGVPIVTTKTGAAVDALTHKETCYFTEEKDAKSIIEGITWMLDNPDKREAIKEEIKKLAIEKYSVEKMLNSYIKLYKGELRN